MHVKNCSGVTPFLLYPKVAELQRSLVTSALTRIPPATGSTHPPHVSKKRGSGAGGLGGTTGITAASPHPNPLASDPAAPSTSTGENQRSGSVSRFFKRLSSKSRSLGRERKGTAAGQDEGTTTSSGGAAAPAISTATFTEMRERASSLSSCRSFRSRHYSSCVVDDLESDISLVSFEVRVSRCVCVCVCVCV